MSWTGVPLHQFCSFVLLLWGWVFVLVKSKDLFFFFPPLFSLSFEEIDFFFLFVLSRWLIREFPLMAPFVVPALGYIFFAAKFNRGIDASMEQSSSLCF